MTALSALFANWTARGLCHRSWRERLALTAIGGAVATLERACPGVGRRRRFAEVRAYQRVFALFREAAARPVHRHHALAETIAEDRARRGAFDAIWMVEGIGLASAEAGCFASSAEVVPLGARVPLHAGLGLSLGFRLLAADDQRLTEAIGSMIADARRLAVPGCASIVIESAGVAVRSLAPGRLAAIDAALADADPTLRPYLWHGVGRALAFLRPRLLSGERWQGLLAATSSAPDEACRVAASGGLLWPLVLANLQRPATIAEALLCLPEPAAPIVRQSVLGASLVWGVWADPDDRLLPNLIEELARCAATAPLAGSLRRDLPSALAALRASGACEELFSLATGCLVDRLATRHAGGQPPEARRET